MRARGARWLGFDVDARAHHVFWPGPGNVTVERNVYFGTTAQFEGEETMIPTLQSEQSDTPHTPSTPSTPQTQPALPPPAITPASAPAPTPSEPPQLRHSTRTRKPSRLVRDLQSGEVGTQLPGSFAEEPEEAGGAWTYLRTLQVLSRSLLLTLPMPEPWSLARSLRPSAGQTGHYARSVAAGVVILAVAMELAADAAIVEWT